MQVLSDSILISAIGERKEKNVNSKPQTKTATLPTPGHDAINTNQLEVKSEGLLDQQTDLKLPAASTAPMPGSLCLDLLRHTGVYNSDRDLNEEIYFKL